MLCSSMILLSTIAIAFWNINESVKIVFHRAKLINEWVKNRMI
jgi:hypothetical protein